MPITHHASVIAGEIAALLILFLGAADLISNLSADLATQVMPDTVALAASVASIVGLVLVLHPALRAAQLRPTEALRYEQSVVCKTSWQLVLRAFPRVVVNEVYATDLTSDTFTGILWLKG